MNDHRPPTQTLLGSLVGFYFTSRRLEDRIRKRCAQAVRTTDPVELSVILKDLRSDLHEHVERLRRMASQCPIPPERRRVRS